LFDLLCGQGKDGQHFGHYPHKYIHHSISEWHVCINTKTSEEISDTLEKVDKSIIAGTNTNGHLMYMSLGLVEAQRKVTHSEENINTSKNGFSGTRSWGLVD